MTVFLKIYYATRKVFIEMELYHLDFIRKKNFFLRIKYRIVLPKIKESIKYKMLLLYLILLKKVCRLKLSKTDF